MVAFRFRSLTRILAPMLLVLAIVLLASCSKEDATTTTVSLGTVTSATTVDQTTATSSAPSVTATTGGTSTTAQGGTPQSTPPSLPPSSPPGPGGSSPGGGSEYTERLPDLQEAVQAKPNDLEALGQLAVGYYQTQAYPKAEEIYKKMLGIRDAAETHNNLGNVYRDWQKIDQAIEQYNKAIELDSALVSPYANLAGLYLMSGDAERATSIAKAGIEKTSGAAQQQLQALLDSIK